MASAVFLTAVKVVSGRSREVRLSGGSLLVDSAADRLIDKMFGVTGSVLDRLLRSDRPRRCSRAFSSRKPKLLQKVEHSPDCRPKSGTRSKLYRSAIRERCWARPWRLVVRGPGRFVFQKTASATAMVKRVLKTLPSNRLRNTRQLKVGSSRFRRPRTRPGRCLAPSRSC